jgi:hypothetical protein
MAAKIIRKEGKKLIIEITVDLENSMLDSEEAIQAVVNEAGTLAIKEAMVKQGSGRKILLNALWGNSVCETCISPPRTRKNLLPLGAIRADHG